MTLFPALVVAVSLACLGVIARDWRRRPRPDKAAWAVAFALFALAAGTEVIGALAGWTPLLARTYYVSGAILVVGFLGLGELYLLAPDRIAKVGPGIGLFLVAVAVALVSGAPVDSTRLATDGWHALERGPALVIFTIAVNSLGTLIVAGGAMYSAWQFWRKGIFRNRMIGCLLIAVGTLIVASGGTLTRLGRPEFLYIAMAVGISIICAGYLQTRRRDPAPSVATGTETARREMPARVTPETAVLSNSATVSDAPNAVPADALAGAEAAVVLSSPQPAAPGSTPAVGYVSELLQREPSVIAAICAEWGAAALPLVAFDRGKARRVWALRLELLPAEQAALDALPPSTRLQVADLYVEVLLQPEAAPVAAAIPTNAASDAERRSPVRLETLAPATERTGN